MQIFCLFLALVAGVLAQDNHDKSTAFPPYPVGDVRNCHIKCSLLANGVCDPLPAEVFGMEVMPGAGFDNLRNFDLGHVHFHNYSTCKISNDGKYLLPDNVFLFPRHGSTVDIFSEKFDHWDKHTSLTASSINKASIGFFSGGIYSEDHVSVKSHMVNDRSVTTRVQVRHLLYVVQLGQDHQLHPNFKSRLFEIAAHLQNNNTDLVHYLAELIVRDFGTHYVTSMDAGAILSQTDHIASDYSSSHSETLAASASAGFYLKFFSGHAFANIAVNANTDTQGYTQNLKHSTFYTHGGPPFVNYSDWQQGIANTLVPIDRKGEPLHFAITPTALPELPETTVQEISDVIYSAINRYYKVNTRLGCTNPNNSYFNFQANLDDGICQAPISTFKFGGVFQTCKVDPNFATEDICTGSPNPVQQVNPLTGNFSCPQNYVPIELYTGTVTRTIQKAYCREVCDHFGWTRYNCQCQNVLVNILSRAFYEAYWCTALPGTNIPETNGYLFGGVYTSTASNPFTGAKSCPNLFSPLHMGDDIQVCVSADYKQIQATSNFLPFAGFDSCKVGNPLAADSAGDSWPHSCPHGYAQHLIAVDNGCDINFCMHLEHYKSAADTLIPARLPPFRKHPKYKLNVTDTLVVVGLYGEIWMKNEDGTWSTQTSGAKTGEELIEEFSKDNGSNITMPASSAVGSSGELTIGLLSFLGSVVLGAIIIAPVFAGCYFYKLRKLTKPKRQSADYKQLNDLPAAESTP